MNNIRIFRRRLGMPPKDPEINAACKQQLSAVQRKRNEVEGVFGVGTRKYSLQLIMARLPKGAETLIYMSFLVMCAETNSQASLHLICHDLCLALCMSTSWLALGGAQEHLPA